MASKFESQRAQLAESLTAVADSMRNCAHIAETFAKIVKDSTFSTEVADLINGTLDDHAKGKSKDALPLEEDASKKRKRKTKTKDPNAPKRPPSSYIIFQNTVRATLKEEFPDLSNTELLGMIAEKWKHMTDAQKEVYNEMNRTAKDSYNVQKTAYDNRSPEEVEAANAATAAAQTVKKRKSRAPKAANAAPASPVQARPPPRAEEVSPTTESSEEEESEDEELPAVNPIASESESSEEEEEKPVPVTKKRRTESAKPPSKNKKSSKA